MSKSIGTRSGKIKDAPDIVIKSSVPAQCKVFYISQRLLEEGTGNLHLERLYHPGKGKFCLFLTKNDKHVMEILEFAEPRRSWLINSEVCSNGHIFLTTPIDVTFFALHLLRKYCFKNALALDSIHDDGNPSAVRILNNFVNPEALKCIADVKTIDGDMKFYKYNHEKAMAWLSLKTKYVAKKLQTGGIYCGNSAVSQNFSRSEKVVDETTQEADYLRMACDYVGGYIAFELHEELKKLLEINSEAQIVAEEKKEANKRKSSNKLDVVTKKQKLENGATVEQHWDNKDIDTEEENKVNNFVKENEIKSESPKGMVIPLKERTLTAKEKSLAKSAKGTKSIASFFTKKTV